MFQTAPTPVIGYELAVWEVDVSIFDHGASGVDVFDGSCAVLEYVSRECTEHASISLGLPTEKGCCFR